MAFTASGYRPFVVGKAGAVGLMQVRFERARRLGYTDGVTGLFKPETNVRYGVIDLAEAWRLANGDLCRALTKYLTGQEEHISVHSAEYCRRVRGHLAAVGSPLAGGAEPITTATTPIVSGARGARTGSRFWARSDRPVPAAAPLQQTRQAQARSPLRMPVERNGQRFWAAHEARIRAITAKLKTSRLRIIAAGSTSPSAMVPRMRGEARYR